MLRVAYHHLYGDDDDVDHDDDYVADDDGDGDSEAFCLVSGPISRTPRVRSFHISCNTPSATSTKYWFKQDVFALW